MMHYTITRLLDVISGQEVELLRSGSSYAVALHSGGLTTYKEFASLADAKEPFYLLAEDILNGDGSEEDRKARLK